MKTKSKTGFKKILIHEDNDLFDDIQKQIVQYRKLLENLKADYENLEIGSFSNEIFRELLNGGMEKFAEEYEKYMESELDKMGTKSTLIRKQIKADSESHLVPLSISLERLKNFEPRYSRFGGVPLRLDSIVYNDRLMVFWVNPQERENILERHCRTYIESEQEKKIYDSLKNVLKAYAEFFKNIEPIIKPGFQGIKAVANLVDELENQEMVVNPTYFKSFVSTGKVFESINFAVRRSRNKSTESSHQSSISLDSLL